MIYLLLLFLNLSVTQEPEMTITFCEDFELNGKGDHPTWNNINWVAIPQRKDDGMKYDTQVKVAYSSKGIYFLFECEDSLITSTFTDDFANLYEEDVIEVFFWTDENYPFYFEYELSPTNYELPIMVPNVEGTFLGWRPWRYSGERKTRHKTSIMNKGNEVQGWKAEFFIPFTLLAPLSNVPPQKGSKWRVNMYRIDYDNNVSTWAWQPIRTNFHDYEKFGTFLFQ